MNHIKRLQKENEILRDGIEELKAYAKSSKFNGNQNINRNDVLIRLNEIENALIF